MNTQCENKSTCAESMEEDSFRKKKPDSVVFKINKNGTQKCHSKPRILLTKILKGIINNSYDINCKRANGPLFENFSVPNNKLIPKFSR